MANAANTRNVRNSKSRQYAQDRNKFGGSSAPKKDSPNYADKSMRSSADSSGQPKGYSVESKTTSKPKPDYSDRTLRSSADSSGQPKSYSSESASKAKPTSQYGLKEASPRGSGITAKGVTSSAVKGLGRLASGLGGASMLLEPGNLSGDETPYKGSKDSYTATSAKDRAADLLNQPRSKVSADEITESIPASKKDAPSVTVKKEVIKSTPAKTSKPAAKTEGQQIREGLSKLAAWNNATGGFKSDDTSTLEDENARTKTEATEASEYKKGGMTKRPPKPAKKVPPRKFASGGSTSRTSASKRGDGCATKGHTKGKYL